jgi:hypothetical protein
MGLDDVRALAMLGETDKALETLEEAVATGWRSSERFWPTTTPYL